jgi:hypothetical protein
MSTTYVEKVFDVAVSGEKTKASNARLLSPSDDLKSGENALRCIVGLLGDTEPELVPPSPTYAVDVEQRIYRFDWIFGITVPLGREPYWNWQDPLRDENAVVVQVLISPGNSGFGFTEISTALVALNPSRDTRSWLESHSEQLGKTLVAAADVSTHIGGVVPGGALIGGTLSAILRASSVISNFVSSGEGQTKNWYIYRFLDAEESCCALEWKINKRVLLEYGPLLRGSLLLAFHGSRAATGKDEGIRMILRPNLGYYKDDLLRHVRPTLCLPVNQRPAFVIKPRAPAGKSPTGSEPR